jgi:hypothetical protein
MTRLLVGLLLLIVVVVGLGVYLDWFHFSTDKKDTGAYQVDLSIDKDKIKADTEQARDKARAIGAKAKDAVTPDSSGDKTPTSSR